MRALLFDMDGVLYNGEQPIQGAAEALHWVAARNIPYLFVTNTSSRGREALAEKLVRFGVPGGENTILNPGLAASAWLRGQEPGGVALFLRPAARSEFEGLPILPDDAETGARYVVIGDLGSLWDFSTLNRAFRLLQSNPEAELIALGMTRFWQAPDGLRLDVAPFVVALEHATGRKAKVFGKPSAAFFQAAMDRLQVSAKDLLMVGDDIHSDIAGAQGAGIRAALVKTGKFRPENLNSGVQPDLVFDSVADLPSWWENR